jgi:serine/threonine-protein kinase ATR
LKKIFETIRDKPEKTGERFENEVLVKCVLLCRESLPVIDFSDDALCRFKPVFHEWFLEAFPEPSAWLRARLAYSRTAAVMSMVGFVLGYASESSLSFSQHRGL